MKLKILAQNAFDSFSDAERAVQLMALVRQVKPDVAVFPEAYKDGHAELLPGVVNDLQKLGYVVTYGPYDEGDGRKDRHGMLLAVKKEYADKTKPGKLLRVGQHNVVEAHLRDKAGATAHLIGVHLNDRTEAFRQAELDDLFKAVNLDEPTIIAGDLNSIHLVDAKGPDIRKARWYTLLARLKLIPVYDPTGQPMPNNIGRRASIYTRLHQMASGKTIARLERAGFTDADSNHQPTWSATRPVVQLDHIMISSQCKMLKFKVLPPGVSDHLGIVAEIEI